MSAKAIYISDDNHEFITKVAKAQKRSRQAQLNVMLDEMRREDDDKTSRANTA